MIPRGWLAAAAVTATAGIAVAVGGGRRSEQARAEGTEVLGIIGERGLRPGRFNRPRGIATDGRFLYAVDHTGRIQQFSCDGERGRYRGLWNIPEKERGFPEHLTLDLDGDLLVSDTHYARILCYSPTGVLKKEKSFGRESEEPGGLIFPLGIAVNRAGEIYVADYGGRDHRLVRFDGGGKCIRQVGRTGSGAGEFRRPSGVAIDREDFVYVADAANHRIQKFTAELEYVSEWGEMGAGAGQLCYPYDVAVGPWTEEKGKPAGASDAGDEEDAGGERARRQAVYVVEYGNHRVSIFSTTGEWLTSFAGLGTKEGELTCPWCIEVAPDGIVYVADTYNHRVQKFRVRMDAEDRREDKPDGGGP